MKPAGREWWPGSGAVSFHDLEETLTLLEQIAEHRVFQPGMRIYTWGDRTGYWYRLGSGAAKRHAVAESGNLQIVDFILPGEWFGLSVRVVHEFATQVIAPNSVITRYPHALVLKLLAQKRFCMLRLIDSAFRATSRLQRHMRVLVRSSPQARVGGFLLELAQRSSDADGVILLPMTLRDVGNYLLLSDDAVSQSLLEWIASGAVALLGERRIRILDAGQLGADPPRV